MSWSRRSTAVVQRFCKPKVGSSILSAGTIQSSVQFKYPARACPLPAFQILINACSGTASARPCILMTRPAGSSGQRPGPRWKTSRRTNRASGKGSSGVTSTMGSSRLGPRPPIADPSMAKANFRKIKTDFNHVGSGRRGAMIRPLRMAAISPCLPPRPLQALVDHATPRGSMPRIARREP